MKIDTSGDQIRIYDFNAEESYRIARRMEQESLRFYEAVAEKLPDNGIRVVVNQLIEEERAHVKRFDAELERLGVEDIEAEHVVDVVDSGVVTPLAQAELEKVLCNPGEAVNMGVSLENRAIRFYTALLDNTDNAAGRAALEAIIAEEQSHRDRLAKLLD